MTHINKPVPGAYQYFPLNEPEIGERLIPHVSPNQVTNIHVQSSLMIYHIPILQDSNHDPLLFKPLIIKNTTFKNRIFVVCFTMVNIFLLLTLLALCTSLRCANIVQMMDTLLIGIWCISESVCFMYSPTRRSNRPRALQHAV